MAIIEAQGLSKCYGEQRVVDALSLSVPEGICWGLLGPNGAGKTTFLRMLTGNTSPSAGSLRVLGFPVPGKAVELRRHIGVVPQQENLDVDFSVVENLRTYASYFGISRSRLQSRIPELLKFAALESRAGSPVTALSGGMQRRLSLARALVNEPKLLILDEPTTGLDPQARQLIWQQLRALRARGMGLVLTTHYMEEATRLCDQVTIMDHGRILDSDSPQKLIARHIEAQVIEVYGKGLDSWHGVRGEALAERFERVGDTCFYYARDERPLLDALRGHPELSYLHRPANLEDVFLRLTGRELRDA